MLDGQKKRRRRAPLSSRPPPHLFPASAAEALVNEFSEGRDLDGIPGREELLLGAYS